MTIPTDLREQVGISEGDTVAIYAQAGTLVIEPVPIREELAEGYRTRASHLRELNAELDSVSREATDQLGGVPDWEGAGGDCSE